MVHRRTDIEFVVPTQVRSEWTMGLQKEHMPKKMNVKALNDDTCIANFPCIYSDVASP